MMPNHWSLRHYHHQSVAQQGLYMLWIQTWPAGFHCDQCDDVIVWTEWCVCLYPYLCRFLASIFRGELVNWLQAVNFMAKIPCDPLKRSEVQNSGTFLCWMLVRWDLVDVNIREVCVCGERLCTDITLGYPVDTRNFSFVYYTVISWCLSWTSYSP